MTTQEKSFWHKTKEGGSNIWEGTKNMAGDIKNAFTSDDEDDFSEELHYGVGMPKGDIYEDIEIEAKTTKKAKTNTKH
jgi:hypothetical protein